MNNLVRSDEEVFGILEGLSSANYVGLDVETTGLDTQVCEIVGCQLSDGADSWYFPISHDNWVNIGTDALALIKDFLRNRKVWAYNAIFERHVIKHNWGVELQIEGDPMLMMILLDREEANLKFAAHTVLGMKNTLDYKDLFPPDEKDPSARKLSPANKVYLDYACNDALWLVQLIQPLLLALAQREVVGVYELELQYQSVLYKMEEEGLNVDVKVLQVQIHKYEELLKSVEAAVWFQIDKAMGDRGLPSLRFNLNSTQKLAICLYDNLGYACMSHTQTGARSTAKEALDMLSIDPLITVLMDYKSKRSIYQSYLMKAGDYIINGKVHPNHLQIGESGRVYARHPNVCSWPPPVRTAVIPDPGHYFLLADWKAQELRIVAALSGDPFFLNVFEKEEDPHINTICEVTGITSDQVDDERREFGKTLNYGLIYGLEPQGLSRRLSIGTEVARATISRFFAKIPKVVEWKKHMIAELERTTFVTTAFGRKRRLPGIKSANQGERDAARRAGINTICQGTGADILKIAEVSINSAAPRYMPGMSIKEQVHDSILLQVPNAIASVDAMEFVRQHAEFEINGVKMRVAFKIGKSWGELEKVVE